MKDFTASYYFSTVRLEKTAMSCHSCTQGASQLLTGMQGAPFGQADSSSQMSKASAMHH